ncbi:methyl-accepting chemotaxis protein [Thioclava kandeliae]|uniref:Methyl-accepting chemotaxis protein n=1 Tax=Thioclava kandeliae TaxID=3070818 RepID=A0ABV1SJD4_9RHOB
MSLTRNLSISVKLPLIIMALVLLSVSFVSVLTGQIVLQRLGDEATERLTADVKDRANRLEVFFDRAALDIATAAAANETTLSLTDFSMVWGMMAANEEMDPAQILTKAFVTDNPYPAGERDKLDTPTERVNDFSYSGLHELHHPGFRSMIEVYGYYDVFLVDMQGNVIYSVAKETDFATNLESGPYSETGLAEVFRAARDLEQGSVAFSDYSFYAPSNGMPAAFIGSPVIDPGGNRLGAIIYQLPTDQIEAIVNNPNGLEETGQAYIVAPDGILRSELRFSDTPALLTRRVDSIPVQDALAGQTGAIESGALDGHPAFIAFTPVQVFGQTWAIVVEKGADEVLATQRYAEKIQLILVLCVLLVSVVVAMLVSRSVTRPLGRASTAMQAISLGNYATQVPDTRRGDEIGKMACALEQFRTELAAAQAANVENRYRSAAFQASASAMMVVDHDLKVFFANAEIHNLLRRSAGAIAGHGDAFDPDDIIGTPIGIFFSEEERKTVLAALSDPSQLPCQLQVKLGESRLQVKLSTVEDGQGETIGFIVEWADVTESYLNAAVLGALDKSQVVASFSPDGVLTSGNAQMLRSYGITEADIPAMPRLQDAAPELAEVYRKLQSGEPVLDVFPGPPGPNGKSVLIEGIFAPVQDETGNIMRLMLIGKDITEARHALTQATAARAQMQAAQENVVHALRNGLKTLADGDLTTRIEQSFDMEYEGLRSDFNEALRKLETAMQVVRENSVRITGDAAEIYSAANDLSQRSERQAATLEETATALDELTISVRSSAEGAKHTSQLVEGARDHAEKSGAVVQEAVEAMGEIEHSSEQINKITGMIDDIAFQTNLLALNAGVEAARAGDAGRGFAVVASEVRALAQRSSEAARDIKGLISSSELQVKRGVELVSQAGAALEKIVSSVAEISVNVSAIATSSGEQSVGLAEVNEAVNQLDQVTQENAARFEETTAATHALTQETETLSQTIAMFKAGPKTAAGGVMQQPKPVDATHREPVPTVPRQVRPAKARRAAAASVKMADGWDEF